MPWLAILGLLFVGMHFALLMPPQVAIIASSIATISLWLLWKLKWVILGIIGLEEIFGGRDGTT